MDENLEVLLGKEEENNEHGVLMGFWDHEKTPIIIKDMEDSLQNIEKRCKTLLQELIIYNYYFEELNTKSLILSPTKRDGKDMAKKSNLKSISVPDISTRKASIEFHGCGEIFRENFKKKLSSINKELTSAANKIGLKGNLFLLPTNKYLQNLEDIAGKNVEKYWPKLKEEFKKNYVQKHSTKSDLTLNKIAENCLISKITQSELELYKKLSKPNFTRKFKKSLRKKAVYVASLRNNFKHKKFNPKVPLIKTYKHAEAKTNMQHMTEYDKDLLRTNTKTESNKSKNKLTKKVHSRKIRVELKDKNNLSGSRCFHSEVLIKSKSTVSIKNSSKINLLKRNINDLDVNTICTNLIQEINKRKSSNEEATTPKNKGRKEKTSFKTLLNNTVPFKTCTSTSRSNSLGTNLDEFISQKKITKHLSKNKLYPNMKCDATEDAPNFSENNNSKCLYQSTKNNVVNAQYIITTYPWSPKEKEGNNPDIVNININGPNTPAESDFNKKQINIQNHCGNQGEIKFRSKYTKTMPVRYHKCNTKQYPNYQDYDGKSCWKNSYKISSNTIMTEKSHCCNNASGDSISNDYHDKSHKEWVKVLALFSNLSRNYASLKEMTSKKQKFSDAALKTLENEIDHAIEKYKKFLLFYNKYLHLRHRLKSMQTACKSPSQLNYSTTIFSACYQRKIDCPKLTCKMASKLTLRKIQDIQNQIRLINEF